MKVPKQEEEEEEETKTSTTSMYTHWVKTNGEHSHTYTNAYKHNTNTSAADSRFGEDQTFINKPRRKNQIKYKIKFCAPTKQKQAHARANIHNAWMCTHTKTYPHIHIHHTHYKLAAHTQIYQYDRDRAQTFISLYDHIDLEGEIKPRVHI